MKEALSWTMDMHGNLFIVESDCLAVVQLIRSAAPLRSRLGKVIEECRKEVRQCNNVTLFFIKRSANMTAHELARASYVL